MDKNSTKYTGPWKIWRDYGAPIDRWTIINTDSGRTKDIGPVGGKRVNWRDRAAEECDLRNAKIIAKQFGLDGKKIRQFVADVRLLDSEGWQKFVPYDHDHSPSMHLFECVACGRPVFQYPCPLCFWGPEESSIRAHEKSYQKARERREHGGAMPFSSFKSFIDVHYNGHYAPFYFASSKQVVAYSQNIVYRDMINWLIDRAHEIKQPSLAIIWRFVKYNPPT